jgi:outer membrane protein
MHGLLLLFALQGHVLGLDEALRTAAAHQPQLKQAQANTAAAKARADEARSILLPQVTGVATYRRTTANFVPNPTVLPPGAGMAAGAAATSSFETTNSYNFGITASQTVWDFGGSYLRWKSAQATTNATADAEKTTLLNIAAGVRVAYFAARAQKALVQVARETLANQDRHLAQIEGFVKVGTRPEIDLAQARTDRANAQVQVINAENGYETTKAQLNQAMGVEAPTDYDVADETLAPIDVEDQPLDAQLMEALKSRPEMASFVEQLRAQELAIRAIKGAYGPSIGVSTSLTDAGVDITNLAWNWNVTATATWPIFQGLLTWSQVKEAKANLNAIDAQRDLERQQIRFDVDQARLQVRAAKAALGAAGEALTNAQERLRLAEGRYQAGVGSVIELGDAQVALTNAAAQKVQAEYNLATARAQLMKALGRV